MEHSPLQHYDCFPHHEAHGWSVARVFLCSSGAIHSGIRNIGR